MTSRDRRRRRPTALVALVLTLFVPTLGLLVVPSPMSTVVSAASTGCQPGEDFALRDLVNAYRSAESGRALPALPLSADLTQRAQVWASWLASQQKLEHSTVMWPAPPGVQAWGENVAYASAGLQSAQTTLQNSPAHRTVMLDGRWTEMGLGVARDARGWVYVVEVFAQRSVATPRYEPATYEVVTPFEVFDSVGQVVGGTVRTIGIGGVGGVPSGATAALATIEAVGAVGRGFVQAVAPGGVVGTTSHLNVIDGAASNTVLIPLASDGTARLYTSTTARLVVTVHGFTRPVTTAPRGGRFVALNPTRLLDTRTPVAIPATVSKPAAGDLIEVQVSGRGGVPTSGVRAVVLNVVAAQTEGAGSVQVGAGAAMAASPTWRNLLVSRAGRTLASLVVVPVDQSGRVALRATIATHFVVDVQGWFTDGTAASSYEGTYVSVPASRYLDTRTAPISSGTRQVGVALRGSMPLCPSAVVGTVTVIPSTSITYAQVGPWQQSVPGSVASVNGDTAGAPVANTTMVRTGQSSALAVFTPTSAHVVLDLSGWFA